MGFQSHGSSGIPVMDNESPHGCEGLRWAENGASISEAGIFEEFLRVVGNGSKWVRHAGYAITQDI